MSFRKEVIEHLGKYKKEVLEIEEKGIFIYRKRKIPLHHILPKKDIEHNIILPYQEEFNKLREEGLKLHRYFHHLNSSQALCINLFLPLILDKRLDIVLDVLGIENNKVINSCFEKESELEKVGLKDRKTNFDFFIECSKKIFFEIKYTEREFGKAKKDGSHKEKFIKTYQPLLRVNGYIKQEYKGVDSFLNYYQIMRNLVHINSNSFVVFLYPEANKNVHDQAEESRNFLTDKGKDRFKILLLERIIDGIMKRIKTEKKLLEHYKAFKLKYIKIIKQLN
jgi:hypothetical protein